MSARTWSWPIRTATSSASAHRGPPTATDTAAPRRCTSAGIATRRRLQRGLSRRGGVRLRIDSGQAGNARIQAKAAVDLLEGA